MNNDGVVKILVTDNAPLPALKWVTLTRNISNFWAWIMSTRSINILAWLICRPDYTRLYRWLCFKFPDNKWFTRKEIATVAPILLSTAFSAASMRVPEPGKEPSVQKTRGAILLSLTVVNGFAYYVKLCMDYEDDAVQFVYYIALTAAGERVFYYKVFQHYMGLVVLLTSVITSFYNFLNKDPWMIYILSMASWSFSILNALLQAYKSDRTLVIVEGTETERYGVRIDSWSGRPPRDRYVWLARVPEAEHIALDIGR